MDTKLRKNIVNAIQTDLILIGDADDYNDRSLAHVRLMSRILYLKRDPDTYFRIRKGWDLPEDERKLARVLSDVIEIDDQKIRSDAATEFLSLLVAIGYLTNMD
jgi:hypothetical protein